MGCVPGWSPFTLILPHVDLFWTSILSVVIGFILASAFSAIVVYAQELVPGNVGMIAGVFFGLMFGFGGIGAALLGYLADIHGIEYVYRLCSFLPLFGVLAIFLPRTRKPEQNPHEAKALTIPSALFFAFRFATSRAKALDEAIL